MNANDKNVNATTNDNDNGVEFDHRCPECAYGTHGIEYDDGAIELYPNNDCLNGPCENCETGRMFSFNVLYTDGSYRAIAAWSHQHACEIRDEMKSQGELDNAKDYWIEDAIGELIGYRASEG